MEAKQFLGMECVELSNQHVSILVTRSVGPRIISLRVGQGENLFAELPDLTLDYPGDGMYHVYGGHRLWHAPEDPTRTYIPDDREVKIALNGSKAIVTQPLEQVTGLQKQLEIKMAADAAVISIKHKLTNCGLWPITCAPWAITQLKVGGVAILPQNQGSFDRHAKLPNRLVSLWPYTDPGSPHIVWGQDYVKLHAELSEGAMKLGFPNRRGWLAYWRENTLFVKRAKYFPDRNYFDYGSSSECFCNPQFLELETIGPISTIEPGGEVEHLEVWEVYPNTPFSEDIPGLIRMIEGKSLEDYL